MARSLSLIGCTALLCALSLHAQSRSAPASADASVHRGVQLVESGRCTEALPLIERGLPHVTDKTLRYQAQMAAVRCAMAIGDEQAAADNLFRLERENPGDPEILYWETHTFSEVAMRAARELAAKYPDSYQAQRLQAESLESQGKEQQSAAIYRKILEGHPHVAGIHYRLGQIALDEAGDSGPTDAAKQQFEDELAIDPSNASAEFILGELARRKGDWAVAVQHFSRAASLDVGFSEAYLALGMSLAAEGKFGDAKPPLEHYVKLEPSDPAGHYQLAVADARTGDQAGARQQMALQAQAAARNPSSDTTQGHAVHP
ncbi:MAG: tetratricopeptide repeat protein [Terracidiphilus sp.]